LGDPYSTFVPLFGQISEGTHAARNGWRQRGVITRVEDDKMFIDEFVALSVQPRKPAGLDWNQEV